MTYRGFVPFTGFDPMDGADDRFTLSRDNPLRVPPVDDARTGHGQRLAKRNGSKLHHKGTA